MAKLGPDMPFPSMDSYLGQDWKAQHDQEIAALTAIEAKMPVLKFQRGDGYAYYAVASTSPLVLRWIPYGDAWQIEPAMIRGLRLADVRDMLDGQAALSKLFGTRKGLPS